MVSVTGLSAASHSRLQQRNLSSDEISDFQSLLDEARDEMESGTLTAKEFIRQMDVDDLHLLQKANLLVDAIRPEGLSEEGATNLLRQVDNSDRVDLNNDGLVEVGIGKMIVFPPVNAPDSVKAAWEQATEGMSEPEKLFLQLHMHTATYGIHIDGVPSKPALSPEEQWSDQGCATLFDRLREGLAFEVDHFGWTEYRRTREQFYNRFESALGTTSEQSVQTNAE